MTAGSSYTLNNYRMLIRAIKARKYSFSSYQLEPPSTPSVLLRHDIDYSMDFAERFARIDMEEGARATFFLQLRSGLYNLFDPGVASAIKRILGMGHYIGFHAVVMDEWGDIDALREVLSRDFALFKTAVPEAMPVFAWHNPGMMVSKGFSFIREEFPGLINVYGEFAGGNPPYYSDSNMRYDVQSLLELIHCAPDVFQLALAPMQWCPEQDSMQGVLTINFIQKIREIENGFMENDVYSDIYPNGLPESLLEQFAGLILTDGSRNIC